MRPIEIIITRPTPLPLLKVPVPAGFPSPADDFVEEEIDLQRLLVTNRPATFLVRVLGDSMIGKQLHDGDLAVVDRMGGVCDLTDAGERIRWLAATKLEEVWGIGPASARKLRALGCDTVADVAALNPRPARKALTVVGERMIYELRGVPCLDLETVTPTRKGCAVTRSFSSRVEDRDTLEQAVATHAAHSVRSSGVAASARTT